jgi:hypothetical protein
VQREQLRKAITAKDYAYNAHGVAMHQHDGSSGVVPDGTSLPVPALAPELDTQSNFTRVETAEMFNHTGSRPTHAMETTEDP